MRAFQLVLAAATASTLIAAALPASAQSWGPPLGGGYDRPAPPRDFGPGGPSRFDDYRPQPTAYDRGPPPPAMVDLRGREDRLGEWLGRAAREHRIDGWQARGLFGDLRSVRDEERSLRDRQYGRLYPDQARRLNDRLDRIKDRLMGASDYARYEPRSRW